MAAYTGRDQARLTQLVCLRASFLGLKPITEITSDDVEDLLEKFRTEPCRTFVGTNAQRTQPLATDAQSDALEEL